MISISIIIPVYNVEAYVKRCIESVMMQEQATAKVECIIVDDCGQDRSMDIVQQLISDYDGPISFSILQHEKNRGISAARNSGLKEAAGDYVLFVDSDDYLMPGSIQYFLDHLKLYPEVDMLMGNAYRGKDVLIHHIDNPRLILDRGDLFRQMLIHHINAYAWAKLIRRDVLEKNQIKFEEGLLYEDILWAYQLFSCLSTILLLPMVVYNYEYNPESIVATTFTKEKADRVISSYTISANLLLDTPPDGALYKQNLAVDYLLYICGFLMRGVDIMSRCEVSDEVSHSLQRAKFRLLFRSLRYGRPLVSCLVLLQCHPFGILQRFRFFRQNYYKLERGIGKLAHLTDFLHNKNRV